MRPPRPTGIGGIVLAGGPGRRLGRPKAGVILAGTTLLDRAVAILRPRCDAGIVVVSRPEVAIASPPAPVLHDRPGPRAPLVALATGLAALDCAQVLVLACDLPLAAPLLDRLLAAPHGVAAVAVDAHGLQPLCARYPRERTLAACERRIASGELALRGLVEDVGAVRVEARDAELLNVNRAADLARAHALLAR